MVGTTKSLKVSGIPILGVKSGKEIIRAPPGLISNGSFIITNFAKVLILPQNGSSF